MIQRHFDLHTEVPVHLFKLSPNTDLSPAALAVLHEMRALRKTASHCPPASNRM